MTNSKPPDDGTIAALANNPRPSKHAVVELMRSPVGLLFLGYAILNAIGSVILGIVLMTHVRQAGCQPDGVGGSACQSGSHPYAALGAIALAEGLAMSMLIAAAGLVLAGVGTLISQHSRLSAH